MKKMIVLLVLLLTACNTTNTPETPETLATNEPVATKTTDGLSDRAFDITVESAKDVYNVGEDIEIIATLTNTSNEAITIGHGASWMTFGTTNLTKDYQFGFVANMPYITQTIQPGESVTETYGFSGATYTEGMPGEPYSDEEFMQMTEQFPAGQYEVSALIDFVNEGNGDEYDGLLSVIFNVQ